MWHRFIGADLTANGALISYLYSPDSGYDQFSLPSGVNDNSNFIIQNSNEIACAGSIAAGSYTITLQISNGSLSYRQNVDFQVVPGKCRPKISGGRSRLTVLTTSGEVYMCGYLYSAPGQEGSWTIQTSPVLMNGSGSTMENEDIVDVVSGSSHSYFLTRECALFGVGSDFFGWFGVRTPTFQTPTELTALSSQKIVQVSTSIYSTLCLTYDGKVLSFGSNNWGQLGLNDTASRYTATSVQATTNTIDSVFIVSVGMGGSHSAVLGADNNIYTCGENANYQTSRNVTEDHLQFYTTTLNPCYRLWVGMNQLFTLSGAGNDLYSAGLNTNGALGLGSGTPINSSHFFTAADLSSVDVLQLSTQRNAAYLLSDSGDVYIFGNNVLTSSFPSSNPTPTLLSNSVYGSKTASQVSTGEHFAAILTEDGSIYTCGRNNRGELGLGHTIPVTSTFAEIPSFSAGTNERYATDRTPAMAETGEIISIFSVSWSSYSLDNNLSAL